MSVSLEQRSCNLNGSKYNINSSQALSGPALHDFTFSDSTPKFSYDEFKRETKRDAVHNWNQIAVDEWRGFKTV
jgi:hypothetical protein